MQEEVTSLRSSMLSLVKESQEEGRLTACAVDRFMPSYTERKSRGLPFYHSIVQLTGPGRPVASESEFVSLLRPDGSYS
jgi:hypothetical protein